MRPIARAVLLLSAVPVPALAQSVPLKADKNAPLPSSDDYHTEDSEGVIITAPFARDQEDLLQGTSVLTGQELTRDVRTTIGETLARQPGVSATSFGPNASRPVLRGLQGERVRVLIDGIGSIDVSNTSVDHAVAINPLTADRIEVLRGPSALLYGSSAIGGVVNVLDSRIPRKVPTEPVHVSGIATYGSAADERSASASVDVPVAGKVVFHVDGTYSKTNDLEIGGFVLSPNRRAEARASGDPDIAALADLRGTLPNSAAENYDVGAGASLILDGGTIGFSVSHFDTLYGVPIRYALEPGGDAEQVRLDVKQDRADLRAEVETGSGFVERLRFRAGAADYQHNEVTPTGDIGTTFLNQSVEARLEAVQAERGGWKGAFGGQLFVRDFNVIGDEKFVPKNETSQFGVFTLQTFDFGVVRAEAGARYEHASVDARADDTLGNGDLSRTFNSYSGSLGASVGVGSLARIGLNATHTERAPAAEELFANGPHAGTQAFEVGNPFFIKEKSNGLEATLKGSGDGYSFGLSGYYTRFNNFIYEQDTGEVEDGLAVFQFLQDDAEFYGFEAEASGRLARFGDTAIVVDGVADYTHATVLDVGPVPRIPPLRLLGGVEAQARQFQARGEVEHVFDQNRVTGFETPTNNFTLVNASIAFRPFGRDNPTSLTLQGRNLFDVDARRHASFLKDFAPLPGRDIRLTARVAF